MSRIAIRARRRRLVAVVAVAAFALLSAGCADKSGDLPPPKKDDTKDRQAALVKRMDSVSELIADASCELKAWPLRSALHVEEVDPKDDWSSDPPTSGKHFQQWADWGFYTDDVDDGNVVHNLEHGGVALWYGPNLDENTRKVIRDELLDKGEKWIVVPRDKLDGVVAASWGASMRCSASGLSRVENDNVVKLLDEFFEANESRETEDEKDIPAFGSGMDEASPDRNLTLPDPN